MKESDIYKDLKLVQSPIDRDRQADLDRYLQYFTGCRNLTKKYEWDNSILTQGLDRLQQEQSGIQWNKPDNPPPKASKRPLSENQLAHAITTRLTALLFGEGKCPEVSSESEETQAMVDAWLKASDFWNYLSLARNYGGAEGSVVIGLAIINGKVEIDVEDAQYCYPEYEGRKLTQLTIRTSPYNYTVWTDTDKISIWTTDLDTPLSENTKWQYEVTPHGFPVLPYCFVQNEQILHSIDGLSDYNGQLGNLDTIDRLHSEAVIGVENNCDPSMWMTYNDLEEGKKTKISTGSGTVLKLNVGESVGLLELDGSGAKVAKELADGLKEDVMQSCRVVLDEGKASGKTATELQIRETALKEHVGELRRQYGPVVEFLVELYLRYMQVVDYNVELSWVSEGVSVLEAKSKAETKAIYVGMLLNLLDRGIITADELKEELEDD